jgi:serine/threonine-protein kinase HipA
MNPELEKIKWLAVYLQDCRVSFDQEYVDDPGRPTLVEPFLQRSARRPRDGRTSVWPRPPPFFSNLLPEGHPRTYLAEKAGGTRSGNSS